MYSIFNRGLFNKTNRSKFAIVLIFSMLLSLISVGNFNYAAAADPKSYTGVGADGSSPFNDLDASYAKREILELSNAGILAGFEDGSFKPKEAMTRSQLAKILVLSLGLKEDAGASDQFSDVPADSWYKGFVGALLKTGITDGISPTAFSPESRVTREQLAVFFIRAMKLEEKAKMLPADVSLTDFAEISEWAKPYVSLAFKIGFLQGVDKGKGAVSFMPQSFAERQALARLAYEFMFNQKTYADKAASLIPAPALTLEQAVKAANDAIAALPVVSSLVKEDKASVDAARAKVDAARKLGALDKDFTNLSKLDDAAKKIEDLLKPPVITGGGGGYDSDSSTRPSNGKCSIDAGEYTGNITVCKSTKMFGPESGTAIIHGTLFLDPGADGDLSLRNIKADEVRVLSGAANSIHFLNNITITTLIVSTSQQTNAARIVTSQTTVITTTVVQSQVILNSEAGSFGNVQVTAEANNRQVELQGNFTGSISVAAVSSTVVIAQGANVAQINVAAGSTIVSSGIVSRISVTSAAVNSQVNLQGSFSTTVVTVAAAGSTLNVAQNTTVSQILVAAAVTISSSGTVSQIATTTGAENQQVNFVGLFTSTTITVATEGSTINIAQNTPVSTIRLINITTIRIISNGTITFVQSTSVVSVVLTGSDSTLRDRAKTAALNAINALPAVIAASDKAAVERARELVNGARSLGATFDDNQLSKLVQSETRLTEIAAEKAAAIQAAQSAIAALPETVTLMDEPAVLAARAKVDRAKAKGAVEQEISNYNKLQAAEQKIAELKATSPMVISAAAKIGGNDVQANVAGNQITFTLSNGLNSSDMVTGFTINASSNADKLIVTVMNGITRTITFHNGQANATVSELLGPSFDPQGNGVSVGTLRELLGKQSLEVSGELRDISGNPNRKSTVLLRLVKSAGAPAPVLINASAVIGGNDIPAMIQTGNYVTFQIPETLSPSTRITGFKMKSSKEAKQLTFTANGVSRAVYFNDGNVNLAVKDLLGKLDPQGDGVALSTLKTVMGGKNLTLTGALTDISGNQSTVTLTILITADTQAPIIKSTKAEINGITVDAAVGSNNLISFIVSNSLRDTDMLTGFTVDASDDTFQLSVTSNGLTRTVPFQLGTAHMTVREFLGDRFDPQNNGISVRKLREQLGSDTVTVSGILRDHSGLQSNVTIIIKQG